MNQSCSSKPSPFLLPPAVAIYLLSIAIYIHPLTLSPTPSNPNNQSSSSRWILITDPQPQLDEIHIMSPQNHDVTPPLKTSTNQWIDAWYNDYWGRPLSGESSHKSWRPFSVWSFRFLKGGGGNNNDKDDGKTNIELGKMIFGFWGRIIGTCIEHVLNFSYKGTHRTAAAATERKNLTSLSFGSIFQRDELLATSELFIHRFVNVIIHAALVQLVGVVAKLLFATSATNATEETTRKNQQPRTQQQQEQKLQQYTQYISQILFSLHPVHVEAVANVANRPHILALLFNITIVDPSIPFVAVGILGAAGLLSSETAIFQYPAIVLMMIAIQYRREFSLLSTRVKGEISKNDKQSNSSSSILLKTFVTLLPRFILLVMTSVTYLTYRYMNGSLTIPDGLIRPAENPFYNKVESDQWTFPQRIINYSYILSLHILKSFGLEIIGFSHEYGFDCIPEITLPIIQRTSVSSWSMDLRILLPISLVLFFVGLIVWSWYGWNNNDNNSGRQQEQQQKDAVKRKKLQQQTHQFDRIQRMLLLLSFFAWIATLFPIAGFLKVGTFVADRLVVASTVGTSIFVGRAIALWLTIDDENGSATNEHRFSLAIHPKTIIKHTILLYLCTNHLAKPTHNRISEWMDAFSLMSSSLKTCPRSIKSNLETSKLYSGLVPHMLDLDKALSLIKSAQSIDPTYCDVHMQYAHVYFQQEKYIPFEEELIEALLCPFTMGQAMSNWNRYWQVLLSSEDNATKERYNKYMQRIQREIDKAEKEEASKAAKLN